jgi:hypothetical protein
MSRAYPCLYIKSYDEALPYYVDFLRFNVDFEWRSKEGLPVYMGVSRGASPGISEGERWSISRGGRPSYICTIRFGTTLCSRAQPSPMAEQMIGNGAGHPPRRRSWSIVVAGRICHLRHGPSAPPHVRGHLWRRNRLLTCTWTCKKPSQSQGAYP